MEVRKTASELEAEGWKRTRLPDEKAPSPRAFRRTRAVSGRKMKAIRENRYVPILGALDRTK